MQAQYRPMTIANELLYLAKEHHLSYSRNRLQQDIDRLNRAYLQTYGVSLMSEPAKHGLWGPRWLEIDNNFNSFRPITEPLVTYDYHSAKTPFEATVVPFDPAVIDPVTRHFIQATFARLTRKRT